MPSHDPSLATGSPGWQLSCTAPFAHVFVPLAAHTPRPHVDGDAAKSSSAEPSQSSSSPSHVTSRLAVGSQSPHPPLPTLPPEPPLPPAPPPPLPAVPGQPLRSPFGHSKPHTQHGELG